MNKQLMIWIGSAILLSGCGTVSLEVNAMTPAKEHTQADTITGFVIEMTSVEVTGGGAAARIPVRIGVQKDLGRFLITDYAEER